LHPPPRAAPLPPGSLRTHLSQHSIASAEAEAESPDEEKRAYDSAKLGRFSLLWTDHAAFDAGYGLESAFSVIPSASRCPSPGLPPFQILNHLPGNDALVTKDGLLRSLNAAMASSAAAPSAPGAVAAGSPPTHVFDVAPTTFLVRAGQRVETDPSWREFEARYRDVAAGKPALRMPAKHCLANLWALKPVRGAGGSGVRVFSDAHLLMAALRRREGHYLVQKVVERPFLLSGRKATLHTFVLVTDTLDTFVWRGAYARLASVTYGTVAADAKPPPTPAASTAAADAASTAAVRVPATRARWVHITSGAAQSDCEDYERFEQGNIVTLPALSEHLDATGEYGEGAMLRAVLPRVRRIVADAVRGGSPRLRRGCRGRRCFEILGADFVLDEDLRPWLVGMSECPSLDGPTHEQDDNVRAMLTQALAIAVDPLCPASMALPRGDADDGLDWEPAPGPPTGVDAAAAAASATQRAGPPSVSASSPVRGAGDAASVSASSAAGRDASSVLSPRTHDDDRASGEDPFSGFDLVFRVRDAPAVLDPPTDDEYERACRQGEAARRRLLADEAVSESRLPPRAHTLVPARGVISIQAAATGLRAWWRSDLGLQEGQVLESDDLTGANDDGAATVADDAVSLLSGARSLGPGSVARGGADGDSDFPTDPTAVTRPAVSAMRAATPRSRSARRQRSRDLPSAASVGRRPRTAATPSAAHSIAMDRVKDERRHATELTEAAERAANLLSELRNTAEQGQAASAGRGKSVSAATIAQLAALAKRLAGEARAASYAAASPARVRAEAAMSVSGASAGRGGRSRSAGRLGAARGPAPSPAASQRQPGPPTPGGRRRRAASPSRSVASGPPPPLDRTGRRLQRARRAQSAQRERILTVAPRVDTGQRSRGRGLPAMAQMVRDRARTLAKDRSNLPVAGPTKPLHHMTPAEIKRHRAERTEALAAARLKRERERGTAEGLSSMMTAEQYRSHIAGETAAATDGTEAGSPLPAGAAAPAGVPSPRQQSPAGRATRDGRQSPMDAAARAARAAEARRSARSGPAATPSPTAAGKAADPRHSHDAPPPHNDHAALPPPEVQVWIERMVPSGENAGKPYYYHRDDKTTRWDRPLGPDVLVMTFDAFQRAAHTARSQIGAATA